jgi:CYTH domain-containing protein
MGVEIERKFLVDISRWKPAGAGTRIVQAYLSSAKERTVRVRLQGDAARLTIKGAAVGISRAEYEYPIPSEDAREMLEKLCERPFIDKTRYLEEFAGRTWEIDVFHGENEGLVVAEIELASEDEKIEFPAWIGAEVSSDPRYFNSNLLKHPFSQWAKP